MKPKAAPAGSPPLDSPPDDKAGIPWDALVTTLETWRAHLNDPSVSTIAEAYRHNAWAVLVSTIISLRTKDAVTLVASQKLLQKAGSPRELLMLSEQAIGKLIYPAGFYKTKSATLRKIAAILLADFDGAVPADMEKLLALPGVGRKTANLVLIEAYGLDGICVDTHVHRICNRMGLVAQKTPDRTEFALREILPRPYWKRINPLLVLYGQNVCKPVHPRCEVCVVKQYCAAGAVQP